MFLNQNDKINHKHINIMNNYPEYEIKCQYVFTYSYAREFQAKLRELQDSKVAAAAALVNNVNKKNLQQQLANKDHNGNNQVWFLFIILLCVSEIWMSLTTNGGLILDSKPN